MEKRYLLSPHYQLFCQKNDNDNHKYTLYNQRADETYLINSLIYTFLSFFQSCNTFAYCVEQFAVASNTTADKIMPQVNQFFGDMFHQSILIRAEEHQHISDFSLEKKTIETNFLYDYTLIKKLSEEDFLGIYHVQNKKNTEQYVMKILYKNAFWDKETSHNYQKIFLQEINILQKIKAHENTINLLEIFENQQIILIKTSYFQGKSLYRFMANKDKISIERKNILLTKIISTYSFLHSSDILHGDIHTSNILINSKDEIQVIDFDMAYHNTKNRKETISTGGVQNFIAPEKISSNALKVSTKKADFRSEVYQLGVIAYFIIFEKLPFEADSWKKLAEKIKKQNLDFSSIADEKIKILLEKSLAKNPNNRFESAIEMATYWSAI